MDEHLNKLGIKGLIVARDRVITEEDIDGKPRSKQDCSAEYDIYVYHGHGIKYLESSFRFFPYIQRKIYDMYENSNK